MEYQFQLIRKSRENFINLMEGLSLESLNQVPASFNNNIIWNFGHIIATQQILCYHLSGNKPPIEEKLMLKYRKGTRPQAAVDATEFDTLKSLAFSLLDRFEQDLKKGIFQEYKHYSTSYGVELSSIADAVAFNAVHEGLHLGYAMAQKKLLG